MAHIQFIHLSDLHFSDTAEDIRRVNNLYDDINAQIGKQPAHVVFTGDLTNSGSEREFSSLADNFLLQLDGQQSIYMCPGNHDILRAKTSEDIVMEAIKVEKNSNLVGNDSVFSICPLMNYFTTQAAFSDFLENGFFTSAGIKDHFDIVAINTAWCCTDRKSPYTDKGNLRINQRSLDISIKKTSKDKVKILMMHHPMSWLDYESQTYLTAVASQHFDFVLYGHEHDPTASSFSSPQGDCVAIEAAAAKANWAKGLNGYSIISIDSESKAVKIQYRSYSPARAEYIFGDDVVDKSIYFPRQSDKEFWEKEHASSSTYLLNRAETNVTESAIMLALQTNGSLNIATDCEPLITRFSQVRFHDGERTLSAKKSVTACVDGLDSTAFFVGPKDSGLTTASHIAYRYIAKNIAKFHAVPIYVNVEEISSINKATLLREVQRGSHVRFTQPEAKTLTENGSVIFIFDGVSIHDLSDMNAIRSTLENYFPNCKSVVFCTLDHRTTDVPVAGSVRLNPAVDTIFEIAELEVDEIRDLIDRKAPLESAASRENLLNNAVLSFKSMGEPIYPTTVSILVDTLKQLPGFKPVNRVRLLDRYIECLLGRYTIEDVTTGNFNSSDKSNILSYIAGTMVRDSRVQLSKDEIDGIILSYSEMMILEVPKTIISEFCDKGILFASGNQYTFRANSIFSYFVAKEMVRNQEIFKLITEGESFFSYSNEVVYYGELEGVDSSSLLESAHGYVEELGAVIVNQYAKNNISFAKEWEAMIASSEADDPLLESALDEISTQVPSAEARADSRENDLQSEHRFRGVSLRSTVQELEARWLIAIRVYLQLLRYSSGIPGPDKMRHLVSALNALELFAQNIAVKRDKISTTPLYSYGGILYVNPIAGYDVEKSKREFKYSAPSTMSQMASDLMSTNQLGMALEKIMTKENEFHQFIARNLLMDIPSSSSSKAVIESIIKSDKMTLQVSSLRLLKMKYTNYRSNETVQKHHKSIIEGLNKEKNIHKELDYERLKKRLSLKKLKDSANKPV